MKHALSSKKVTVSDKIIGQIQKKKYWNFSLRNFGPRGEGKSSHFKRDFSTNLIRKETIDHKLVKINVQG